MRITEFSKEGKEAIKKIVEKTKRNIKYQEKKRIIKIINKKRVWESSNEKINIALKYYNQALEELEEELEAE